MVSPVYWRVRREFKSIIWAGRREWYRWHRQGPRPLYQYVVDWSMNHRIFVPRHGNLPASNAYAVVCLENGLSHMTTRRKLSYLVRRVTGRTRLGEREPGRF